MKERISLLLRIVIGFVFIISAYSKIISPGLIEIILIDHGITGTREVAANIVRLLIGFELGLGLLFLQPFALKRIVIPGSFLFLVSFTAYLLYTAIVLKDTQNCGCFGEMIKLSPLESIIKNIVLIGLLIVLYKIIVENKKYFVAPIIIIGSVILVFIVSPVESYKDFKFIKYTNFMDAGRVDLTNGDKLIVILNTECDHCQNLAKELSVLKRKTTDRPEIYGLIYSEGTINADSFKVFTKLNFPYRMINMNEFLDLIGQSPPRIYWLQNGSVKEYWDKDFIDNLKKISK
jgi:hypothetical protein